MQRSTGSGVVPQVGVKRRVSLGTLLWASAPANTLIIADILLVPTMPTAVRVVACLCAGSVQALNYPLNHPSIRGLIDVPRLSS